MQESSPQMDDLPTLDTHAHVWDSTCEIISDATYRPNYQATTDTYMDLLDRHGVERAVLVQPSFLGTDNRYLLQALAAHPDRLRGIVVLDPAVSRDQMDDLSDSGIIGLRLNMMHSTAPDTGAMTGILEAAAERGWWIEIHAQGDGWATVLHSLPAGARVMIDHFGRASGPDCPGLAALCELDPENACVKLSAPYRVPAPDLMAIASRLINHFGAARCLWGSDWPWTQFEGSHDYGETREWLATWTTDRERTEMRQSVEALCGF